MPTYSAKLFNRREIAEGTMSFCFEKPAGFQFRAGQFVILSLIDPPETDQRGSRRAFSVASAPFEKEVLLAMRMRDSAFKRVLRLVPIGAPVAVDGPFGEFDLPTDPSPPAVFLAGGIGITPFRSLAKQAAHDRSSNPIFLFYSNRRPEDAAFLQELEELETSNPNFRLIATMTQIEKSSRPWPGETGYIDRPMLEKYLGDLKAPVYYLAGPPAMVNSMREVLSRAGVSAANVRVEIFGGY